MRKKILKEKLEESFGSLENFNINSKPFSGAAKRIWNSLSHSINIYESENLPMERLHSNRAFKIRKFLYASVLTLIIGAGIIYSTPLKTKASEFFIQVFDLENNKKLIVINGDKVDNPKDLPIIDVERIELTEEELEISNKFLEMERKNYESLKTINVDDPRELQRLIDEKVIQFPDYNSIQSLSIPGSQRPTEYEENRNQLLNLIMNYYMNSGEYGELPDIGPNFPKEVQDIIDAEPNKENISVYQEITNDPNLQKYDEINKQVYERAVKVVDQIKF